PKGPFPGAPVESSVAVYHGVGAPSWMYTRPFQELKKRIDAATTSANPPPAGLGPNTPSALLRQVVTDGLFNSVLSPNDTQGLLRARTTAWALCYFLAKDRLPGLMNYFAEISALPRDMEFDAKTLLGCFARAFDVANASRDDIDPAKFDELAKSWLAYFNGVAIPGAEFGLDLPGCTAGQPGRRGGQRGIPPGQPPGNRGGGRGGRGGSGG